MAKHETFTFIPLNLSRAVKRRLEVRTCAFFARVEHKQKTAAIPKDSGARGGIPAGYARARLTPRNFDLCS